MSSLKKLQKREREPKDEYVPHRYGIDAPPPPRKEREPQQRTTTTVTTSKSKSGMTTTTTTTTTVHVSVTPTATIKQRIEPFEKQVVRQCCGVTSKGIRCAISSETLVRWADSLRSGRSYCSRHDPNPTPPSVDSAVTCRGVTKKGVLCTINSNTCLRVADPLRAGGLYCTYHDGH